MRPWELYEYTFDEFIHHVRGYQLSQAYEWDRTRNIMYAVIKSAGGKGIKKVSDVMKIPLIDKRGGDSAVYERLRKRLEEFKKDGKSNS